MFRSCWLLLCSFLSGVFRQRNAGGGASGLRHFNIFLSPLFMVATVKPIIQIRFDVLELSMKFKNLVFPVKDNLMNLIRSFKKIDIIITDRHAPLPVMNDKVFSRRAILGKVLFGSV